MADIWIMLAIGALFALVLGRSAIIAFWPESEAARFYEFHLGAMDRVVDSNDDDGGGDGGGGD
ncbi:hypothetical protein KUV65_06165 [Maritalea mobilis]|uniref:hypothetical protein n=1 Tax=Maritalea mobilis TaxID=483324 RepID=UPI001C95715F|nr:hypothetical protein [Maritalea mobilis]MBY6200939.1 hypothetical protein [Maritalea mobilis]